MQHMNQPPNPLPSEPPQEISREDINQLPIRRYEGSIHLVSKQSDLRRVVQDISQEGVLGFDTETRPAFRRGVSYLPSLVQFATAHAVYLFQVQLQDYSAAMRDIFSSDKIVKTGVSVNDDLRNLQKLFEFQHKAVVDLGEVGVRYLPP